ADEVRRECGSGDPGSVTVTLEGAGECPGFWVARREAVLWSDLLRNFIRNAVQASEDRHLDPGVVPAAPPAVAVRLRPLPGRPGAALEIADQGVGMSADAVAAMWRSGHSSHGAHRGQGLTESKRAFLVSHAGLEVRSAVGVGTCVRLEVPQRDVRIRAPRLWALPPIAAPLAALLLGGSLAIPLLGPREVVTVETRNRVIARGMDAGSWVVWQRNLGEPVLENYLGNPVTELSFVAPPNEHLMLHGPIAAERGVVLATAPAEGPGRVWRLDGRGRTRWVRTLRWAVCPRCGSGSLRCDFEVLTPWAGNRRAIALDVTNGGWSCTSLQFVTPDGDSVGAYYHPGPLRFFRVADVDDDGRAELVLMGRTDLPENDPIAARDGGATTLSSLILLEPPEVSGQAFPWSRWDGIAPAREEACLLVPPLRWNTDASIRDLRLGTPPPGGSQTELQIADGRIYRLDARFRPLSCGVAAGTPAAALAPTRAVAPLVYLSRGTRENIDLPIRREP
ncbi:MAG TPA: ATP-binding protein, partial [Terriglobales bacterium]|nr:ATP-binding protein [Terriglobales bacterium]